MDLRWLVTCLVCADVLGCGASSTPQRPIDGAARSPRGADVASRRVPLPPGAFASVPIEDWPCTIDVELAGGDVMRYELEDGALRSCVLPAPVAVDGVVGCPARLVAYRPGDDEPSFTYAYTYDGSGRLVATQDGEAAPTTYRWEGSTLTARDGDVVYASTDAGFTATEDGETVAVGVLRGGLIASVELRFPALGDRHASSWQFEWKGTRLVALRGEDVLTPEYRCRDRPAGNAPGR